MNPRGNERLTAALGLLVIVPVLAEIGKHPARCARAYALAAVVIGGLVLGAATVPVQHRRVNLRRDHHDRKRAYEHTSQLGSSFVHAPQQP